MYICIKYALLALLIFPFLHAAVLFYVALGPTQLSIQCIAVTLPLGLERLQHEADC
jgi:hypothetical protein